MGAREERASEKEQEKEKKRGRTRATGRGKRELCELKQYIGRLPTIIIVKCAAALGQNFLTTDQKLKPCWAETAKEGVFEDSPSRPGIFGETRYFGDSERERTREIVIVGSEVWK